MPRITKISEQSSNPDRVSVFIDDQFCKGIRKRTFQAMGLKVGDEIDCASLEERENYFWKQAYGEPAWEKEKVRLGKVKSLIETIDPRLLVTVVGFGAETTDLIKEHPEEKGSPDLNVAHKDSPHQILMKVEVTGTERLRGDGYWVRPDKLEYAENHPEDDVWIVLHFAEPEEKFVFIKPQAGVVFPRTTVEIRGAGEIMCVFSDKDNEVYSLQDFVDAVSQKVS